MNSTPTTTKENKCSRRRYTNQFKSKVVLFYRQQKELREITSAQQQNNQDQQTNSQQQNNQDQQTNSQPKNGKKRMEQVYGSMSFISRITGIDRRQIAYWIEHGDDILETKFKLTTFKLKSKKPICICTPMEIRLSNWIIEKRQACNSIAGYQIKTKAFDIYDEIHPVDGIESNMSNGSTSHENSSLSECSLPRVEFKASDGWLSNFCQRRGFVLRRVSSCGRELPHNCLDIIFTFYRDLTKTIEFNKFEKRQIINMDESCQYLDAPSQYTYSAKGAKRTVVHTTGSEKTRLSGAWTGAADGTKLPLYLIVPRVNALSNFHVPENVILTYHPDSVFNTETIISYFQRIIIPYKIAQNLENVLLIIDSARCHLTTPVQNFCTENGIYLIYVPPRLTNLLQPADVSWFASLYRMAK